MSPGFRRIVGLLPVLTLAGILPSAWFVTEASAEARKFVVLLSNVPKTRTGNEPLQNVGVIWDAYFDKEKNGQNGGPRVDSHAEWWEEISYGIVTVSGDVYGWVDLPWGTLPNSIGGGGGGGGGNVLPWVELTGGFSYDAGEGESFNPFLAKFRYDLDGVGQNPNFGNFEPIDWPGAGHFDDYNQPVFCPGEYFVDLNGNRVYDAGVPEWGIDKNGNGQIDVDDPGGPRRYNANSIAELFAVNIRYPQEGEEPPPPVGFQSWANQTEWFDANRDGAWNRDGFEFSFTIPFPRFGGGVVPVTFYRGDWGGVEIFIIRDGASENIERIEPGDGEQPPTSLWRFLVDANDPENQDNQNIYFDEQWNDNFDFPEPFEDFMRRWNPNAHAWTPVNDAYIAANYPGPLAPLQTYDNEQTETPETNLLGRTGNGRYDAPDGWTNRNNVANSNKLQEVVAELDNAQEREEQAARSRLLTPEPEFYTNNPPSGGPAGWSLNVFWQERYGTEPPEWLYSVPYLRVFEPPQETPRPQGGAEGDTLRTFVPNRGGPRNNGFNLVGVRYGRADGTVLPDVRDQRDGMYDGLREFDDLPSSIYHAEGDGHFGEITSPINNKEYGQDIGAHDTNRPAMPDTLLPAAGPLAFLVHGGAGWDAGNQLNLEYLTWRTDGTSNADVIEEIDFDGDGLPDFTRVAYHKDVNLDGLLDLGETIGDAGQYGLPRWGGYFNYGVDADPGTPPNGDPSNPYPFSRKRAIEDAVAATDDLVRWDVFLGGPPPHGSQIHGLILLPNGTGPGGMFTLPAGGFHPIRTRDLVDATQQGRDRFTEIPFFDGLGIALDGEGEGGLLPGIGEFATAFAGHEYGHRWEGWPDLYDYDVYSPPPLNIDNNPIARWCVMAGGGLCHPVPILKESSGWLDPVDITRALTPTGLTDLTLSAWEFDRNRTVYKYINPVFPGEQFYFWRNSTGTATRLSFDRIQPGFGMLIMHVDRGTDPESLPPQQRIASHSTYQLVQADGLEQLENGENGGDAGDPWPGSSNNRRWTRNSDPNNRWYNGQGSGLEIADVETLSATTTRVRFRWLPQELPTLSFVQPPGGISVNGIYPIRYFAYDQFGGTRIDFYAFRNEPGTPLGYVGGIPMGSDTKTAGEVDGTFNADVSLLPDGTYTFFAVLNPGTGVDGNQERTHSIPRASINNVGTGSLEVTGVNLIASRLEVWTAVCINANPPGAETWRVVGSISGEQTNNAVTGVAFQSDPIVGLDAAEHSALSFIITSGNLPYRQGDTFSFVTTGITAHSAAVLVDDGQVVEPEPPIARARIESGSTSGLAPFSITFKHDQSSDPRGAALTFIWDFGDGSPLYQTDILDESVPHTFTTPRATPYPVRLTARNAFGLESTATINITVNQALPPTVRVSVEPQSGPKPLRVRFTGDTTTDPNPGTIGLDYVWDFGDGSPVVTTANAEHEYVEAGVFRATLTVTNRPYGQSASLVSEIRVSGPPANQPPTAAFDADRLSGNAPLVINFDARRSFDPEGGALTYTWNFGDGTPLVRGVSQIAHTFTRVRTYNVTLTVADPTGQTDTFTMAVVVTGGADTSNQSPVARIVASGIQGAAPFTVTFDGSGSSDPEGSALNYQWDFDDGSAQESGAVVTHTFTTPRTYNVILGVTDSGGASGADLIQIAVTAPSGGDTSGQDQPEDVIPELTTCGGGGCGPAGLMPILLTMLGIGGLRRVGRRLIG
jgi:PKD repeat protein